MKKEDLFNFSECKDKIDKFWEKPKNIGFYEKVFICFNELIKNEKFFYKYLLNMWNSLEVETLN